jgi:thiosulfate dehydrogenase [quinone] large subunit
VATNSTAVSLARARFGIDAAAIVPAAWLFVRLLLGVEWLRGAQEKIGAAGWTADPTGSAVTGFLNGALAKTSGAHPEVQAWFATLTNHVFLPHAVLFTYLVTYGELVVGIALVLGVCTRFAALGGAFLNFVFLSAGTTSSNPQMLVLAIALVLLGGSAGAYGLDRWAMPWLVARVRGERGVDRAPIVIPAAFAAAALGYIVTDQTTWLVGIAIAVAAGVAVAVSARRSGVTAE